MSPASLLACAGAGGPATVAPSSLLTGLVGYWKLDETSLARIDSSGNGYDLTANNTPTSGAGVKGNAAQFVSANSQSLTRPDQPEFSLGAGKRFTMDGFVNVDSIAEMLMFGKGAVGSTLEYALELNSSTTTYRYLTQSDSTHYAWVGDTGFTPVVGAWNYVCMRYDGTNLKITINHLTWTQAYSADLWDFTHPLLIGGAASGYVNGRVDEVGWWNRALTDAEVAVRFNGFLGSTYPFVTTDSSLLVGLVNYWKLDEPSSTRADLVGGETLTDNNTVTAGTGPFGAASLFTRATGEYLSHADDALLSQDGKSLTFNCWIKATTVSSQMYLMGKGVYGSSSVIALYSDVGVYRFLYSPDGAAAYQPAGGAPSTTGFHMITGRVERRSSTVHMVSLWVDGAMVGGETNAPPELNAETQPFVIGAQSNGTACFDGVMSDVAVWNRALSAFDIGNLWSAGAGVRHPFVGVP